MIEEKFRISESSFEKIRSSYGHWSSWAMWEMGEGKRNIGEMSVFDFSRNPQNRSLLHAKYVLVGLNISRSINPIKFVNFHDSGNRGTDYRLRAATVETNLWGAYATDIIKDYVEVNAAVIRKGIKSNAYLRERSFSIFQEEIHTLGVKNPVLVTLGNVATEMVELAKENGYIGADMEVVNIPHYAARISHENYRSIIIDKFGLTEVSVR